jgi:hypothetical protein
VAYATGTTAVYSYASASSTSSGFSANFTVNISTTITITNSVTTALGISGALNLLPISAYISYANTASSWTVWIANPTYGYKMMAANIISVTTPGTVPTLTIKTAFTSSELAGSGQMALNGDSTTRLLAHIYLAFSPDII